MQAVIVKIEKGGKDDYKGRLEATNICVFVWSGKLILTFTREKLGNFENLSVWKPCVKQTMLWQTTSFPCLIAINRLRPYFFLGGGGGGARF